MLSVPSAALITLHLQYQWKTAWQPFPLSSGLSLWISMCSSSTSLFLPTVFFISFPSLSKSLQSAQSQVKMPRGAFTDELMTFSKGQRNRDYSSGSWWASSSSSSWRMMEAPWHLEVWGGIDVKWQQVLTGWQLTNRSGSNATLPIKMAKSSFKSQWSVSC